MGMQKVGGKETAGRFNSVAGRSRLHPVGWGWGAGALKVFEQDEKSILERLILVYRTN